jgi:hypothetical protein
MTPAEWARGLALAVFTGALHAAFVAKLFTQRLTAGSSPWYVTVAPTLAVAVLTFAIHRYLALEAKEQSRLIPETAAADPDSLFTNVDDVNVHYKLRRPKKGPPRVVVSCCHGFGANTYSWERCAMSPLAEALGAAVVAHDSPGFGLTCSPHRSFQIPAKDERGDITRDAGRRERGVPVHGAADGATVAIPQAAAGGDGAFHGGYSRRSRRGSRGRGRRGARRARPDTPAAWG